MATGEDRVGAFSRTRTTSECTDDFLVALLTCTTYTRHTGQARHRHAFALLISGRSRRLPGIHNAISWSNHSAEPVRDETQAIGRPSYERG